jgi:hypothetical protein
MKKVICRSLVTVTVFACCVQAQTLKKIGSIAFNPRRYRAQLLRAPVRIHLAHTYDEQLAMSWRDDDAQDLNLSIFLDSDRGFIRGFAEY